MRARIVRWGNSLAIRLPKAFAETAGMQEGSSIELEAKPGEIVLRGPRYTVEELVGKITRENRHPETEWGPPVGKETW